jgi:hypothetical protein
MIRMLRYSAFALALALMGCSQVPLPHAEIRSGLKEAELAKLIGREPSQRTDFALPEQPEIKYRVVEYYLAPGKQTPEYRYWFLFGANGLIGYGRGDVDSAKSLAYDTYFEWLASHGLLKRAVAERRMLDRLTKLYGEQLNPLVAEYFKIRIEVMSRVDAKKIEVKDAEATIRRAFARRLGGAQLASVYGGTATSADRYTTLTRIGLDVRQSGIVSRPTAAGGVVSCGQLRNAGATEVRCF